MYKFGQSNFRYMILIVALLLLFAGCTTIWQPVCRHNAVYQALTVGRYYPVRIALGPSNLNNLNGGRWHAQAQAFIDGRWRWLTQSSAEVRVVVKDPGFTAERYVSLREAIEWIGVTDKHNFEISAENQQKEFNPGATSILYTHN